MCLSGQSSFAGALNHGTVGNGIAERHSKFDNVCASFNCCKDNVTRGREIGIATSDIGNERGLFVKGERHSVTFYSTAQTEQVHPARDIREAVQPVADRRFLRREGQSSETLGHHCPSTLQRLGYLLLCHRKTVSEVRSWPASKLYDSRTWS